MATVNAHHASSRLFRLPHVGIVLVPIVVAAIGLAISARGPTDESTPPGEVIDRFLSAAQAHDSDSATALFQSDATIAESGGTVSRGRDAAMRFIKQYDGYEAGPQQVTGNEVVWTESLPIWRPESLQATVADREMLTRLSDEVPMYEYVQVMCAVVTDGKIHAVIALAADSERSCKAAEPLPTASYAWLVALATGAASLAWLGFRCARQPAIGRRHFLRGLAEWHRSMIGTGPWTYGSDICCKPHGRSFWCATCGGFVDHNPRDAHNAPGQRHPAAPRW